MTNEKEHKNKRETPRLEVYKTRSVLVVREGHEQEFKEGDPTKETKKRLEQIRSALDTGYLEKIILECQNLDIHLEMLDSKTQETLSNLVNSITAQYGRGLVGLTMLQLTIKSIAPDQSVRLHKGGGHGNDFSWEGGIPMRSLDKDYFTPVFRKYDLVRLNADGCFMTRSLAENYPYTQLYKAAMRGAQDEWLEIIDLVESGSADPLITLKHLIRMLLQKKSDRKVLQDKAVSGVKSYSKSHTLLKQTIDFILEFAKYSSNASRVFEVGMHSLFQVFEDLKALDGYLAPLSQMRSANKKHGNIGDIEITNRKKGSQISEAWDAKYGKPYLRKELDELDEKLREHPETKIAGFVVDSNPNLSKEIKERIEDLEKMLSVEIVIMDFSAWAISQVSKYELDERKVASEWLIAFAETLCELRRNRAPIDEPSAQWAENLISFVQARENQLF